MKIDQKMKETFDQDKVDKVNCFIQEECNQFNDKVSLHKLLKTKEDALTFCRSKTTEKSKNTTPLTYQCAKASEEKLLHEISSLKEKIPTKEETYKAKKSLLNFASSCASVFPEISKFNRKLPDFKIKVLNSTGLYFIYTL